MIIAEHLLSDENTLGIAAVAEQYCRVTSLEMLQQALAHARSHQLALTVLGGGSNVVMKHRIPGLVIAVALPGRRVSGNKVITGAGEVWDDLVEWTLSEQLYGLENLSLIPGLAGAAPMQNIGAYGVEQSEFFVELEALDIQSGEQVTLDLESCDFGYRQSRFKADWAGRFVVTSVTYQLQDSFTPRLAYADLTRHFGHDTNAVTPVSVRAAVCDIRRQKLPDPAVVGNAGSFFKNPLVSRSVFKGLQEQNSNLRGQDEGANIKLSAAQLIELAGMKGVRLGNAAVSSQHALVLVNLGSATGSEILDLANLIVQRVQSAFGVVLEIEPVVIG